MEIIIEAYRPTPTASPRAPKAVQLAPTTIQVTGNPLRVLDFDIENRPLSYLGSDFTTSEVTAVSWAWTDRPDDVTVCLLGEMTLPEILDRFVAVYHQADVLTGHFIRAHDLPTIQAALIELGRPPLTDKLTQDTKLDFIPSKGISRSQESLSAMFGLTHDKVHMNQARWRSANRLTPEGLQFVRERVVGDVQQHIELRKHLLQLGYLRGPRMWSSGSARIEPYTP